MEKALKKAKTACYATAGVIAVAGPLVSTAVLACGALFGLVVGRDLSYRKRQMSVVGGTVAMSIVSAPWFLTFNPLAGILLWAGTVVCSSVLGLDVLELTSRPPKEKPLEPVSWNGGCNRVIDVTDWKVVDERPDERQ